jgi:uncharacterized protein (TIGR02421 family)
MNTNHTPELTHEQELIRVLSDRIVDAQKPIRILDAIKWDAEVEINFFKHDCKELPMVDEEYYVKRPLGYDLREKFLEFYDIERDIKRQLGQFSGVGKIMLRMCREYRETLRMLQFRGQPEFSRISQQLYGSSEDAFYAGAPTLKDLAGTLCETLPKITQQLQTKDDEKIFDSEQAAVILNEKLATYFAGDEKEIAVKVSDTMVSDAAAGADCIRIRSDAKFSARDLQMLEVHEGWVHLGTTRNGLAQPICTFLSKGPPSSTVTQEGLAIMMEIFTFSSFPHRVQRITDRINAIAMAENGANFLEVFHFLKEQGMEDIASYKTASRVFRGSTPELGPFTKDLSYNKGFILLYNFMRVAIKNGLLSHIPMLFVGKTSLEDVGILYELQTEGIVVPPRYMPRQISDLAALSSWMCYSSFMNKLNLTKLSQDYMGFM